MLSNRVGLLRHAAWMRCQSSGDWISRWKTRYKKAQTVEEIYALELERARFWSGLLLDKRVVERKLHPIDRERMRDETTT